MNPMLDQLNSTRDLIYYVFKIRFNIILTSWSKYHERPIY